MAGWQFEWLVFGILYMWQRNHKHTFHISTFSRFKVVLNDVQMVNEWFSVISNVSVSNYLILINCLVLTKHKSTSYAIRMEGVLRFLYGYQGNERRWIVNDNWKVIDVWTLCSFLSKVQCSELRATNLFAWIGLSIHSNNQLYFTVIVHFRLASRIQYYETKTVTTFPLFMAFVRFSLVKRINSNK